MNSIDRRRHPRVTISVDVDIETGSNFYTGQARDISEGGVFIESPLFAPVGTRIDLSLRLQGHRHQVPVEVMWVLYDDTGAAVGFGARFLEMRRAVRRAIQDFMSARAPMPFELLEPEDADEAADSDLDPAVPQVTPSPRIGPPPLPDWALEKST